MNSLKSKTLKLIDTWITFTSEARLKMINILQKCSLPIETTRINMQIEGNTRPAKVSPQKLIQFNFVSVRAVLGEAGKKLAEA